MQKIINQQNHRGFIQLPRIALDDETDEARKSEKLLIIIVSAWGNIAISNL